MISWGSQQWRLMRRALRDGATIEEAAEAGSMDVPEAKLLAAIDEKNAPLPPEAFALIYDPDAPRAASSTHEKEASMAKEDKEAGEGAGINGEYQRPNAALAFKIYDEQIAPKETHLATIKGDMSEPHQQIKDQAHFPRKVLNFILALESEEDAKRDHFLLALSEGLKHRKMFKPRDLVTMASGEDGDEIVPTGERQDDGLDGLAADLESLSFDPVEGEDVGDFGALPTTDVDEEQVCEPKRGRGRPRKVTPPAEDEIDEPAYGTGAAAIAAMSGQTNAVDEAFSALN